MLNKDALHTLDELLLDQCGEEGMLLSEFDGFCAGLLVCPELILPTEWLPHILDGDNADQLTPEDFQHLTDLLMRHYNDVAAALAPPAKAYGPLLDEDTRTGEILWETWCHGFECAMLLRPDAWKKIVESDDEEAAASINMMLALVDIAEGRSNLPKASIDTLTEEAPDIIPHLVLAINAWTKSEASAVPFSFTSAANHPNAPFKGSKVGRNAPCPCGSGRKYKRCCGAN